MRDRESQRRNHARVGQRVGAYLIDLAPALVVTFTIGLFPIVGAMMAGFILFFYWLLRDIRGASLGKLIVGLRVTSVNGSPATLRQKIIRNVPLAIGPGLLMIPLAGYVASPAMAGLIVVIEAIRVVTEKDRIGDRWAGTTVQIKAAPLVAKAAGGR